ncbi:hypothetical protein GCM10018954_030240 [Kutzneria kofuensis]
MLNSLSTLSGVAVDTVNKSQADLIADLKDLQPTLTQLAATGQNLPKSLQLLLTFPFPDATVAGVKGDYTNLYADLDLNLGDVVSNLGRSRQSLLPSIPGLTGGSGSGVPLPLPHAAGRVVVRLRRQQHRRPGRAARRSPGWGWALMLTRKVRLQIIAFVVIALVGVSYAGFRYAGVDRLFGPRGYAVNVALADSGGIFTAPTR